MKTAAGQYECVHKSGIGLDYFTSRVDRLTLQPSGRFVLIVQDRSRIAHAAQSLASGQQVTATTPEVRREGSYVVQGTNVLLRFEDGAQQQGQLAATSEGGSTLQLGQDVFTKTSDSTLLPSADRLKKDMEDIAKGLKIASTIGGAAIKAMKTLHDTIQSTQSSQAPSTNTTASPAQATNTYVPPAQQYPVQQAAPIPSQSVPPYSQQSQPSPAYQPAPVASQQPIPSSLPSVYCDQCGTKARPGKRFCSACGASLY